MVFLGLIAFFGIFPLSTTLYAYKRYGSITQEVCRTVAYSMASIISFAFLLLFIALCVYQLIKVHDAYYVKTELKGKILIYTAYSSYRLYYPHHWSAWLRCYIRQKP